MRFLCKKLSLQISGQKLFRNFVYLNKDKRVIRFFYSFILLKNEELTEYFDFNGMLGALTELGNTLHIEFSILGKKYLNLKILTCDHRVHGMVS